jgi:hypothetical protein
MHYLEVDMHIFGIAVGWLLVTGYFLAVMNYFVKVINRKVIMEMPDDSPFRKRYTGFMRFIVKNHGYIALYLVTFIFLHLLIELVHKGFFITGLILGSLLLVQIFLGAYGAFVKDRKKGTWLYIHRTLASLLFVAIIVHVSVVIALIRSGVP